MDIAIALILSHQIILGHVCDIHPRGPGEWIFEEECRIRKENEDAEKVLEDESASDLDIMHAQVTLMKNGKRS